MKKHITGLYFSNKKKFVSYCKDLLKKGMISRDTYGKATKDISIVNNIDVDHKALSSFTEIMRAINEGKN